MSQDRDGKADLIAHIRQSEVCTPECPEFQRLFEAAKRGSEYDRARA